MWSANFSDGDIPILGCGGKGESCCWIRNGQPSSGPGNLKVTLRQGNGEWGMEEGVIGGFVRDMCPNEGGGNIMLSEREFVYLAGSVWVPSALYRFCKSAI